MARLSIPVNPRELREVIQSSLELVPSAKIFGLLRTFEKIALQTSTVAPCEVGVVALKYVDGQWEIHPRSDDLHKESVVISVLHGLEKKVLIALHSNLFGQLFKANGHPQKEPVSLSGQVKMARSEPATIPISAVQKRQGATGASGVNVGSVFLSLQSTPQDGKAVEPTGNDNVPGATRNQEKRITISERNLFLAIKNALDGLEFADLLALNRSVLDAVDALKSGASRPGLKGVKRLVCLEGALNFELENEEPTAISLVRGLLAGLGFNALMQLHCEFSSRMNVAHAVARKTATDAVKGE